MIQARSQVDAANRFVGTVAMDMKGTVGNQVSGGLGCQIVAQLTEGIDVDKGQSKLCLIELSLGDAFQ